MTIIDKNGNLWSNRALTPEEMMALTENVSSGPHKLLPLTPVDPNHPMVKDYKMVAFYSMNEGKGEFKDVIPEPSKVFQGHIDTSDAIARSFRKILHKPIPDRLCAEIHKSNDDYPKLQANGSVDEPKPDEPLLTWRQKPSLLF